ncbi:MAG: peptidoglycan bridge formation glycyltransferase FemA/FemB family protein [Spirochaetaceae bacterium]|jgi:lipid II:glycine glycyltransferase (peptidoglycan interpeptide bridge formation enzyme)|nr:peptidoglycan bridge formation glycyltransferase FemA/FemB family protein [Spirochaetaceae bacterium]
MALEGTPVSPIPESLVPKEDPVLKGLVPAELPDCGEARSFLQSSFWGAFKARFGWKPLAFRVEWLHRQERGFCLVLHRPLGPGISFAYVPWGPELPESPPGQAGSWTAGERGRAAAELAGALRLLLPRDTAFIRFDLPWYWAEDAAGTNAAEADAAVPVAVFSAPAGPGSLAPPKPFIRAAADVQPPDSVLVDLTGEESAILAGMKPKWRYNVGLAERKNITLRSAAASGGVREELEKFYALYRETADRDGISIHGREYYAALFEEAAKNNEDLRLYMASHGGEDIAGIITLFRGREGVYLYGASANHKRNLMAPYALQWRAMRDAKAAGCGFYDLFGIPPEADPEHPMAGLYRFKTGFGGRIIHRPGSWDYPYRPLAATLYRGAEGIRKKIWDSKKRRKRHSRL